MKMDATFKGRKIITAQINVYKLRTKLSIKAISENEALSPLKLFYIPLEIMWVFM